MVVVNFVGISCFAPSFGKWREQKNENRSVAELVGIFCFIPDYEQRAALLVGIRLRG